MIRNIYSDFWLAENHLCSEHKGYAAIIKSSPPQALIRFNAEQAQVPFETFFKSTAQVSWFGDEPPMAMKHQILLDAWNFLALENDTIRDKQ